MTLHIFNPENDMALADGHPGYTPPAQIQQMRHELWWLPRWWAADGDVVWNGSDRLALPDDARIVPWGWSPALCQQLREAGVQASLLPSAEALEQLRQLSHRRTSVQLLGELREQLPLEGHLADTGAVLCHTMEETEAAVAQQGDALLKSPWSSSGRGLMPSSDGHWQAWARHILRSQGSLMVERLLHKVADFALEFWLDGKGGVQYRGLSLFYTNGKGAYQGNWVAPEGQKLQWLMQYVPAQCLIEIRRWWEQRLARYDYCGPVGIDMMLAQEGVCPCIEVNWRMTMGLVSCLAAEQGRFGRMVVEYVYGHYSAEIEAFG